MDRNIFKKADFIAGQQIANKTNENIATSQSPSQSVDQSARECPAIPQSMGTVRRNECQHQIDSIQTNFEIDLEPRTRKYVTHWQIYPVPKLKTNLTTYKRRKTKPTILTKYPCKNDLEQT